jgi:hypothetical protein
VDVAHKWSTEAVDEELDRLISRRASQDRRPDPNEQHELWRESVRRYNARRREERSLQWCDYFSRLAGSLQVRAEEYDQRAQTLMHTEQRKETA